MNSREPVTLTAGQVKDLKVLIEFIHLYCLSRHAERNRQGLQLPQELAKAVSKPRHLCSECSELLLYGMRKREKCPLDPKPACKECHVHCYTPEYRSKIREIMSYSGRRMVMRGRLDYLWHYFF